MASPPTKKLKKELGLFDVYAICTGAMFSSGFFLLPGLAAAQTGPSVALAYLIAGILMLPAMFSMAELSTAMPRAGGDYYFIDRALGPLMGTVGGMGTYLALTLKSAFALIGMGAYIAIFFNVPIQPLAVVLTVVFTMINIFGAKETTSLQRILVTVLVAIMALFIVDGVSEIFNIGVDTVVEREFTPFFTDGIAGLLGTVGFVFVSYAGLTKIASVSEEVKNPQRNIPLGMMLSIFSTSAIYVVGVIVMISVLDADTFRDSLTPVADAARVLFDWLPGDIGLLLVVASAAAAFASTGNAGILAASRYPFAMGRDHLIPARFATIGQYQTPAFSILVTAGIMIGTILFLDESTIAKIASGFQLLIFMLVNISVIVMRESRIEFYDPGYRTPLYPWMQIFGIGSSVVLLAYLGATTILLTLGVASLAVAWYIYYGHKRVARHGAIFHWFEQLGERRYIGLEHELREIMKEKGLREEDPFEDVITRAQIIDLEQPMTFEGLCDEVIQRISQQEPLVTGSHADDFIKSMRNTYTLIEQRAALPNLRLEQAEHAQLVMVRSRDGVLVDHDQDERTEQVRIHAFFFLVSPEANPGQHLRILAELSNHISVDNFVEDWQRALDDQELKEIMLHDERLLTLWLNYNHPKTAPLIGQMLRDLHLPTGTLVALIRRNDEVIVPSGSTLLSDGDRLTIIGNPDNIQKLYEEYVGEHRAGDLEVPIPV